MEADKSFVVVIALILFSSSGLCMCSPTKLNVNDTWDDVWDVAKKATNIIVNLTKPALDNEIKKESQGYVNASILEPINQKIKEHTDEIKYEKSSILLVNSDITLLKGGVSDLNAKTVLLGTKVDQMKNMVDIMDIRVQHALNNTEHLKSLVKDNVEELHTLNGYVQENSVQLHEILEWIRKHNSTFH